jgi:homotetrameric cytidine deaminase/rRNA maturation RNase YbeY
MNITYSNEQKKVKIPQTAEKLLLAALEAVGELHALSANTEVDVTIVTDKEIHKINKAYRNVDRPTDVLSFAFDETDGEEPELLGNLKIHLLGNIIISAETALRQGKEYGHGISRELAYLAVHGCLHLLGYDHMVAKDKAVMRKQEELALKKIKLSQEDLDTPAMDKRVQKKLWRLAVKAREHAYAPYSKFKVGAAVLTADGKIFTGCNVENASYGLTCCAERNTMFAAVGEGAREFTCLCVVADTKEPVLPCGACLQVLAEFKVAQILLANCAGALKLVKLADLLPYGFGKAALQPSKKNKKA